MLRLRFFCFLLVFSVLLSEVSALYIAVEDPDIHDWTRSVDIDDSRNMKQFIGYNFDWSGVGRSSDGWWATMISDQYFLSANHAHPGVSSTITYYIRDFSNGSVTTTTATVTGGQQISGTDLWVGKIDSPLSTVTWYDLFVGASTSDYDNLGQEDANETLPDLASNPDDVTNLVMLVGRTPGDTGSTTFRVGLNATSNYRVNGDIAGGKSIDYLWSAENPFAGFTDYEAYLVSGDSGAPTFYAGNSNTNTIVGTGMPSTMTLLGIHSGNSSGAVPSGGSWSTDSLPGEYLTEIDAILNPVPEPAHYGLIFGFLLLFWIRFFRNSQGAS